MPAPTSPDNARLRKVSVRVDESRQNYDAAPIADFRAGMRSPDRVIIANPEDAPVGDRQAAIGVGFERVLLGEGAARRMQNRRAKNLDAFARILPKPR